MARYTSFLFRWEVECVSKSALITLRIKSSDVLTGKLSELYPSLRSAIHCFVLFFLFFCSQWSRGWVRTWKQPQSMHNTITCSSCFTLTLLSCEPVNSIIFSPPVLPLNSAVSVTCVFWHPNRRQPTHQPQTNPPLYLSWCHPSHLKTLWNTSMTPCAS